jgi:hypothetical protein
MVDAAPPSWHSAPMRRSLAVFSILLASSIADAAPAKDPKIVALAGAAAKCKFEDNYFDEECKAYKAWRENEKLFEEGKGDATILAMFEDADVKMRLLASEKGFDEGDKVVADKGNVTRLLAVLKKETHPSIGRSLTSYVTRSDFEKHGLVDDVRALTKHTVKEVRDSLGFHVYADKQSPVRLEITKTLLGDSDPKVAESAMKGLSMGAARGKAPEACKMVGEQIGKSADMLWSMSTSGCSSVFDALAAELLKRSTDANVAAKDGVTLGLAISFMCKDASPAQKTKGFNAAKALTDAKVKNANARTSGISAAAACDKAASKPLFTALSKDSDKLVADKATKELPNLDKK